CGCWRSDAATPGVMDGAEPKTSVWIRLATVPKLSRPTVSSSIYVGGRRRVVPRAPGAHACPNVRERQNLDLADPQQRASCSKCGCGRGAKFSGEFESPRQKGAGGGRGLRRATRLPSPNLLSAARA